MAGVSIKITTNDQALRAALDRVSAVDSALIRPLFKNWGELMVKATHARFDAQRGPDGTPWAKLNRDYEKTKRGPKILQESGQLYNSIIYQVSATQLAWGTGKVYGAIHQLGGVIVPRSADFLVFRMGGRVVFARKVTIPARPYLGVSDGDRAAMIEMAEDLTAQIWDNR